MNATRATRRRKRQPRAEEVRMTIEARATGKEPRLDSYAMYVIEEVQKINWDDPAIRKEFEEWKARRKAG